MNWHVPETPGFNSEEEAEKCRTERRKMLPIITRVSHMKLEKYFQFSKCELRRESKPATRSIDCSIQTEWRKNLQEKGEQQFRIRVRRIVENVCNSSMVPKY